MISLLEIYPLTCSKCGKVEQVRQLVVDCNLRRIEATFVCSSCGSGIPARPAPEQIAPKPVVVAETEDLDLSSAGPHGPDGAFDWSGPPSPYARVPKA